MLLFYAYHTWERLTFSEELQALQTQLNLRLVFVLKDPPEGWQGEMGLLSEELLSRHLPQQREGQEYFICGPVPMIQLSEKLLYRLGVPMKLVHSEPFDLV